MADIGNARISFQRQVTTASGRAARGEPLDAAGGWWFEKDESSAAEFADPTAFLDDLAAGEFDNRVLGAPMLVSFFNASGTRTEARWDGLNDVEVPAWIYHVKLAPSGTVNGNLPSGVPQVIGSAGFMADVDTLTSLPNISEISSLSEGEVTFSEFNGFMKVELVATAAEVDVQGVPIIFQLERKLPMGSFSVFKELAQQDFQQTADPIHVGFPTEQFDHVKGTAYRVNAQRATGPVSMDLSLRNLKILFDLTIRGF